MPKERCEEQSKLALAAVAAMNRVYDAKNELDTARKRKLDTSRMSSRFATPKQRNGVQLLLC